METIKFKAINGCHVVAMPFPGRGHINPMINFCTFLALKNNIFITLVLTEEWLGLISNLPADSPNLRLRSIPNVLPSEWNRAANLIDFYHAVETKMEAPFEELLDLLELPVSCIVADLYLKWVMAVGNRRNIPVVSFWTQAPSVFSVYYHFHLLAAHGHFPDENLTERGEEIIDYLPGVSPMRLADLPSLIVGKTYVLKSILETFSFVTKAQSVLFTSFYELQPNVIDGLRANLPIPMYTIGPSIPFLLLKSPLSKPIPSQEEGYINWLNSQPEASVLYVSLGSFLSTSKEQMLEFAMGLQASGVRYLWIVRSEESSFKAACSEIGFMVPWCDQLRVLCHPSVTGFLTHAGWNSTMESIYAGVPMLTFPLFGDQIHNTKLIVEDLRVGLKLKRNVGLKNIVGRAEIAQTVKRLMDLNGNEGKELRERAKELQETCQRAINAGGPSDANVTAFIEGIRDLTI